jgi:hypothetical protein
VHNEEICNLYSSLNINRLMKSRSMSWTENVARIGRTAYSILAGKPERKRPLRRRRRRWVDNIKMDLRGTEWVIWTGLICLVTETSELSGSIKCWEFLAWLHKWRLIEKSSAP